jgi:hypothetical protein
MLTLLPEDVQTKYLKLLRLKFFPFATSVHDPDGASWAANISENFRKNSKRPYWIPQGLGGNWFMKKTELENLVTLCLKGIQASEIIFLWEAFKAKRDKNSTKPSRIPFGTEMDSLQTILPPISYHWFPVCSLNAEIEQWTAVFRIRIRKIRVFLGLPEPHPDPSISFHSQEVTIKTIQILYDIFYTSGSVV